MPFDADITSLLPNVELEDMYATYSPATEQDFTSDVVYTVTAEDKVTTKDYTVHVEKQAAPQVNSITFEDPEQNSESRVQVRINGDNLDNAANALNHEKTITVSAKLVSGESEGSGIQLQSHRLTKSIITLLRLMFRRMIMIQREFMNYL